MSSLHSSLSSIAVMFHPSWSLVTVNVDTPLMACMFIATLFYLRTDTGVTLFVRSILTEFIGRVLKDLSVKRLQSVLIKCGS